MADPHRWRRAYAAIKSMRRLAAHPAVAGALAAGEISKSWARQVCEWTDLLPAHARGDADAILLAAASGGADLRDLAGLAEEMYQRTAPPDRDGDDDGFRDRSVSLAATFRGAGKLSGNLIPECTAALQAVFEALAKPMGPAPPIWPPPGRVRRLDPGMTVTRRSCRW